MSKWKDYSIEDFAEVKNTLRIPLSKLEREKRHGDFPYYGASGIIDYVDDFLFEGEHVLISEDGENLKSRKTPIAFKADGKFWVNNHAHILKGKRDEFNDLLVYYFVNLNINEFITGAVQPKLSKSNLLSIPMFLPEDEDVILEIVGFIKSLTDKIDLLHRQNQTLEQMAETLFRQWFVEEEKDNWEVVLFEDFVKHVKPGTNYQPKRVDFGIPFLNVRCLENGFINTSNSTYITQSEYERVHSKWVPEANDVLISRIGTLGLVAVLTEDDLPIAVHYNMINLKAKMSSYQFLYFLLKSKWFQEEYLTKARQSVQAYLAIDDVKSIELKLPIGTDEFIAKQEIFNSLFDKIKSNQTQIRTLTALRDTLLPKLMSGEVSLSNFGEVKVSSNG